MVLLAPRLKAQHKTGNNEEHCEQHVIELVFGITVNYSVFG